MTVIIMKRPTRRAKMGAERRYSAGKARREVRRGSAGCAGVSGVVVWASVAVGVGLVVSGDVLLLVGTGL